MARLIPDVDVESIGIKPERDVARALIDTLPDNVSVYHSYPWLNADRDDRNRKQRLREGEADFVILIPEIGFLILEVKGGWIEFDPENRSWGRRLPNGGLRSIKDPFEQARTNTHVIKEKIVQTSFPGENLPPCTFGYSVVFPDCEYHGSLPPGCENATIMTAKDLPFMAQRIPSTLRKWCRIDKPIPMNGDQLTGVKRGLNSNFRLIPLLSRQIEEDEEKLVQLTDEQARLLDYIQNHKRCRIEGVAGSGKTLLAIEQAKRFSDHGMKTLFVCYNKALAQWLRNSLPLNDHQHIDIYHFHGLCKDICSLARLPFSPPSLNVDAFFRNEAPSLLLDAIEIIGPRYDAVVVDEGQDFDPDWWLPLELMCNEEEKAPFFLFYDPAQNLFVDDPGLPDLGNPFALSINCRNTRQIAKTCSAIRKMDIETHKMAPEGKKVTTHLCPDAERQYRKSESILKELRKNGLGPTQIVIQSPFRKSGPTSSFKSFKKIGGFSIVTDTRRWKSGEGVLFTTIRAFKGLEADVVIMVDLPEFEKTNVFTRNDFYVGASRAKHVLEILARNEAILAAPIEK